MRTLVLGALQFANLHITCRILHPCCNRHSTTNELGLGVGLGLGLRLVMFRVSVRGTVWERVKICVGLVLELRYGPGLGKLNCLNQDKAVELLGGATRERERETGKKRRGGDTQPW